MQIQKLRAQERVQCFSLALLINNVGDAYKSDPSMLATEVARLF